MTQDSNEETRSLDRSENSQGERAANWQLTSLAPKYDKTHHGGYFRALNDALKDPSTPALNIALSGPYGSGKSSILKELEREYPKRVVQLSLSTLNPSSLRELTEQAAGDSLDVTNYIQKEFVKQLLYRLRPGKTPYSRFRRLAAFQRTRGIRIALFFATLLMLILISSGYFPKFLDAWHVGVTLGSKVYWCLAAVTWIVLCGLVYALQSLFGSRINIQKLGSGPAVVTLADESGTFFDQYLDEIIYFFETSSYDLVVIEDIDRFDEPRIFETLRALNTLINNADQVTREVRFIYAIKDSIFESSDEEYSSSKERSQLEQEDSQRERANRTKFFDLIIPVVPFVDHQNARDLVKKIFAQDYLDIPVPLLNIIAKYAPDMRLLHNIRNEFVVYKSILNIEAISREADVERQLGNGDLQLEPSKLLALILYKNLHFRDFERIRLGKSSLDSFYRDIREISNKSIVLLGHEIIELTERIKFQKITSEQVRALKKKLDAHIDSLVEQSRPRNSDRRVRRTLQWQGRQINDEQLLSSSFWKEFFEKEADELRLSIAWSLSTSSSSSYTLFRKYWLNDLSGGDWLSLNLETLRNDILQRENAIELLRKLDFYDALNIWREGALTEGIQQQFRESVDRNIGDGVLIALMEQGFVNRNFTLYTSPFYQNILSSNAKAFLIHNIEKGLNDISFDLSHEEVISILKEASPDASWGAAWYNISILDYMLVGKSEFETQYLEKLIADGRFSTLRDELLERYFARTFTTENERQATTLIRVLTHRWPCVFSYLARADGLDSRWRVGLLSIALSEISTRLHYEVGPSFHEFMSENSSLWESDFPKELNADRAEAVANLFSSAQLQVQCLRKMTKSVRAKLISRNLYHVNVENLREILELDRGQHPYLDVIWSSEKPELYAHVLKHMGEYLKTTSPKTPITPSRTIPHGILADIVALGEEVVTDFIKRLDSDSKIEDLQSIDEQWWSQLFQQGVVPLSVENLNAYWKSEYFSEGILAAQLRVRRILVREESSEDVKKAIALKVLAISSDYLEGQRRVDLVEELNLETWVSHESLPEGLEHLYGSLLRARIIQDERELLIHALQHGWETAEEVIINAESLEDYATGDMFTWDQYISFLRSRRITENTKEVAWGWLFEVQAGPSKVHLEQLYDIAVTSHRELAIGLLLHLRASGMETKRIIELLALNRNAPESSKLKELIESLADPYPKLADPNQKAVTLKNTSANQKLLEWLSAPEGPVLTYKKAARGESLRVTMRGDAE